MFKNKKTTMYKLDKNGYQLEYQIKRSKRSKNLRIEVTPEGVKVTAPCTFPEQEIIRYTEQKKDWIIEKFSFLHRKFSAVKKEFTGGEIFLFQGRALTLLVAGDDIKRPQIHIQGDRLIVILNNQWDEEKKKAEIKRTLKKWYISSARQEITEKVNFFSRLLKVCYNQIYLKEQKTRWGSCSSKGNLNFNWKLIMAPPQVIEYIIVHEMCHLIHMNHSKDFWRTVESVLADYRERRKWLKENAHLLTW